jgi:hypothetical protein
MPNHTSAKASDIMPNMPANHLRVSALPLEHHLAELQGEVHALKGMLAVLVAHVALLNRAPLAKRDEILNSINSMVPGALASIEQNASAGESAGFERAIETVTHVARNVVRIEPVASSQQGDPSR